MIESAEILEKEIQIFGLEIFNQLKNTKSSFLNTQFYTDLFLNLGMKNEDLKTSLFRFVDVLPSLQESSSVVAHAQEYLSDVTKQLPVVLQKALNINSQSLPAKLAAAAIKKQISFVAKQFIVGATPQSALKSLKKIRRHGHAFTVDLLGEATVSEEESIHYQKRYLELVSTLAKELPQWEESAPLVKNHFGEKTALNISVKLSALYSQSKALNFSQTKKTLSLRLGEIASEVKKAGGFIYVDMEDTPLTSVTIETFKELFSSEEFKNYDRCGLVLQAYLRRTAEDIKDLISWSKSRGTPVAIRLVKGAYWDTETILAKQQHLEVPVWEYKESTDANYELLTIELLKNHNYLFPAFASHNIRSLCHAIKAAEKLGVPATNFEIQALYGMAAKVAGAFSDQGFLVREYAPVGELIPGMGYLVRRLLENTSNEGFLRQGFHENKNPGNLLNKPLFNANDNGRNHLENKMREKFTNIAPTDFSIQEEREKFQKAIAALIEKTKHEPFSVKPIIEGKEISSAEKIFSLSPENPELKLAEIELCNKETAIKTVAVLNQYFPIWSATSAQDRSEILFNAAAIMEKKRVELSAIIILEAGKPWAEADADVVEAIDFLNYYAHQALKLFNTTQQVNIPGELNSYQYEARGICLVISPWNFPLAIPCGMFAAALVTGNCAILKPAEQTSLIARELFDILLEAGLPGTAAAFLPGIGEEIGPDLVKHPAVTTVVFTGSKSVGLQLIKQGAESSPTAFHVKRVITEMGGKNAIIIDEDADLDEAIKGIIYSAFGFQGQKCSACSRAIVVGSNYQRFLERLKEATKSIIIGPASNSATFVGPVIDQEAFKRIQSTIENAKKDCNLLVEGGVTVTEINEKGYFINPTIFTDIPKNHNLLFQEVFGPVLAVVNVKTLEEAIDLANSTEYALTGGIYSRSPKNIALAKQKFKMGNLYINRGCTGAVVNRQPFGGARMSGVGSKAGGPDYLLQFVIPRVITENTIRRGFAPVE